MRYATQDPQIVFSHSTCWNATGFSVSDNLYDKL